MGQLKVMITGGRGMVGRNVRDAIAADQSQDCEVFAPFRDELDLRDTQKVTQYIADLKPDVIIHSAGKVGGIASNAAHPVEYLSDNLRIGQNVVMASLEAGVPQLLNLGSSCIYPKVENEVLTEDMILTAPLEPTNEGYALAKIAIMRLCQYIEREKPGFHYRTLIPCNLYGRYDKFDPAESHLLPAIIHKVHHAKRHGETSVEIWGDGTARREFMYASDLATFIADNMADLSRLPDIMNIGVGDDHSINDYYRIAADVIGWSGKFTHDLEKPVGVKRKLCSVERQTALGWQPSISLEEGITATYDYYLTTPFATL